MQSSKKRKKILWRNYLKPGKKILPVLLGVYIAVVVSFLYHSSFSQLSMVQPSPQAEAKRISEVCRDVKGDQATHEKCTAHQFADAGERWGVEFIGEVLVAYQKFNEGYQNYKSCHVLAHRIMNDLGSREPGKWKELMMQMTEGQLDARRCGGGFLHGLIEVQANVDPDFKVNAGLFKKLCADTLKRELSSTCAHILGHLALVEAIEAQGALDDALKACDGLSGNFLFQCYGGIFMEDSIRTNLNAHGLADLPERNLEWLDTQVKRCSRYVDKKEMTSGCWYDLPEVYLQTHNYDLEKTYAFCESAPIKDAYDRCYRRASYLVAIVPDTLFKSTYPKTLCAVYPSESPELVKCMHDVIGAALTGSMDFIDRTVSFCTERGGISKDRCFGFIAEHVARSSKTPEERQLLCNTLPEKSRASCLLHR